MQSNEAPFWVIVLTESSEMELVRPFRRKYDRIVPFRIFVEISFFFSQLNSFNHQKLENDRLFFVYATLRCIVIELKKKMLFLGTETLVCSRYRRVCVHASVARCLKLYKLFQIKELKYANSFVISARRQIAMRCNRFGLCNSTATCSV